jgi:hypothetical protein
LRNSISAQKRCTDLTLAPFFLPVLQEMEKRARGEEAFNCKFKSPHPSLSPLGRGAGVASAAYGFSKRASRRS